jgi:KipI family sensor histidine kinase inhibitor
MLARDMPEWVWQGERGMLRSFEGSIAEANAAARALATEIASLDLEEVSDVVPGARTLLVELVTGGEPSSRLQETIGSTPGVGDARSGSLHSVGVTYDGADVEDVAGLAGVSVAEIVSMHSSVEYTVAFIGFQPGFPYLIGLPSRLVMPRLDTPRARVPAGSVAIAGEYTGIYPSATPGGWRLIGRSDVQLFDVSSGSPALLSPGDRVRFVPA